MAKLKVKKPKKQSKQKPKVPLHKPRRGKLPIHEDLSDELFQFFLKSSIRAVVDDKFGSAWENLESKSKLGIFDRLFQWTLSQPTIPINTSSNVELLFLTPQPELETVEIEDSLRKKRVFKRIHPSLLPLYQYLKFNLQYEGENEGSVWLSFKQRFQRHNEETLSIHMLKDICNHIVGWISSESEMDTETTNTAPKKTVIITLVEVVCQVLNNLVPSRKSSPYEMPFQSFSDPDDIGVSVEHRSIAIATISILLCSTVVPREVKQLIFEMLSTNILKLSMSIPLKSSLLNGIISVCQPLEAAQAEEQLDMETVKLLRTAFHHLELEGSIAQFGIPIRPPIHINALRATPDNDEDDTLFSLLSSMLSNSIEWLRSVSQQEESLYLTERAKLIQTIAFIVTYKSFRNQERTLTSLPLMLELIQVCSPLDWAPFDRLQIRASEFIGYLVILGPLEASPFTTVLSTIPGVSFTGEANPHPATNESYLNAKKLVKQKIETLMKQAQDRSDPRATYIAAKSAIALLATHLVVDPPMSKKYFHFVSEWMEDPNPCMKTVCLYCLHQAVDSPPIISRGSTSTAPQPEPLPTLSSGDLRVVLDTYTQLLDSPYPRVVMMSATGLNSPNLIMTLTMCQKDYLAGFINPLLAKVMHKLESVCFGGCVDTSNWSLFQLTLDSLAGNFGVWSTCPLPPISTSLAMHIEEYLMFVIDLLAKTNKNRDKILSNLQDHNKKGEKSTKRRKTVNSLRSNNVNGESNSTVPDACLLPVNSKVVSLREYCARAVIKSKAETSALPSELNEYIEYVKESNQKLSHETQLSLLNLLRALCISGFVDTVTEQKFVNVENAKKIVSIFSALEVPPERTLATARTVDRLIQRLPAELDASEVAKLLPILLNPLRTSLKSIEATEQLQYQMLSEVMPELLMTSGHLVATICDPVIEFLWEFIANTQNPPSMRYTASELLKGLMVEDQPWYINNLTHKLQQGWMKAIGPLLADMNDSQYDFNKKHILDECLDNMTEMFDFLFETKERTFKSMFKKQFTHATTEQAGNFFMEFSNQGDEPNLRTLIINCGITPSKKRKRSAFREGAVFSKTESNLDNDSEEDDFFPLPMDLFGPGFPFGFHGMNSDDSDDDDLHVDYGIPTIFHNHPHEEFDSDSDFF